MKKYKKNILEKIILFLFLFFSISLNLHSLATNNPDLSDIINEQYDKARIDEIEDNIPQDIKKELNELGINSPKQENIQNFNIFTIFKYIFSKSIEIIKTPLIIFANCIAIILVCSLFNSFKPNMGGSNLNSVLGILMALCTCAIIVTPIIESITNISTIIKNFGNFMFCFIPVFTGIIAMSKGALTSIGYNSTVFIMAQVISSITSDFLLPITGSFLALSISGSLNENFNISGLTSAIKKTVIFLLSFLVSVFVGIFTIQSSIASNADSMAIKTAKFLSNSFIPIVGGALGDALSSIVGGLNIIKSAVGGFGIIVCIITLLPPILTVIFFIIFTAIAKEVSVAFEAKTMEKTLAAVKDCLSILLAFLISYGILIISTTSIIITTGAG